MLSAGESFALNTDVIGTEVHLAVLELPASFRFKKSQVLSLVTGDNIIYTVPTGITVSNLIDEVSVGSGKLNFSNNSGGAISMQWFLVPNGEVKATKHAISGTQSVGNNTIQQFTIAVSLNPGDKLIMTSDTTTSTGVAAWISAVELA
jgi:hypothetical protein